MERGRVEFASVARRICWEGFKEGKGGGGGEVRWCGLLGTLLSRGCGVGEGVGIEDIRVCFGGGTLSSCGLFGSFSGGMTF